MLKLFYICKASVIKSYQRCLKNTGPLNIKKHVLFAHSVKSVQIWSFSGPYFPAFGLNTDNYSVNYRVESKCKKIRTRKNSLFGLLLRSGMYLNILETRVPFPTVPLDLEGFCKTTPKYRKTERSFFLCFFRTDKIPYKKPRELLMSSK